MTEHWTTIEQAAVALGLSVRTVNRHINAGKLQSRLNDGRREVLLESAIPAAAVGQPSAVVEQLTINDSLTQNDESVNYEAILALADNAADKAELAVSAYQTLARHSEQQVMMTRRLMNVAWCLVAVLAVVAIVSVGWTSHKLTRAAVETEHLQQQVTTVASLSDSSDSECDDLRRALADAQTQAARAEGRLAAYTEARQTAPTTRPTFSDRIASIFENN